MLEKIYNIYQRYPKTRLAILRLPLTSTFIWRGLKTQQIETWMLVTLKDFSEASVFYLPLPSEGGDFPFLRLAEEPQEI